MYQIHQKPSPSCIKENNFGTHRSIKLLILGKDGVGKSAIVVRYLTRRFIGEYDPLLEGVYTKVVKMINNQAICVQLKDTSSGINWSKRSNELLWTDALVLVYSITDRKSFIEIQNIKTLLEQLKKSRGMPYMILGNKLDMNHERQVTEQEGSKLAATIDAIFYEMSASESYQEVELMFDKFIQENCEFSFKRTKNQFKTLASQSSIEIRQKLLIERPKSQPELKVFDEEKMERKGKILWRMFKEKMNE
ncbi:ras-related and estrogen-regulated growth inhibitor isoform X2 [Hydra vulgaris]|uniref:small monomeric GTPase n=1 Tax=Hydra vulgaris TaxID=6087 RepID=A0ABM4BLL1_HYDVU